MRNQPKYNFFKNTTYALKGLKDMITSESSFKIEILFVILLVPVIVFIDTSLTNKILMFIALMGVVIAEAINSAIERVVDLVNLEYSELAGRAKDVGSSVVFFKAFFFVL